MIKTLTENKVKFVVIFCTLIISYYLTLRVDAPNYEDKIKRHRTIIENTIEYPYKYRVLNPFVTQATFTIFKTVLSEKPAYLLAVAVQNFLIFLFLFHAASKFFNVWFEDAGVILSLLLFALLIPLSLTGYDVLGDMTTAGLFAIGSYFINSNKIKYLFLVLLIGAFNELQIIILVLFYFFSKRENLKDGKVWINSILLVVTFLIGYAIIYLLRGGQAGGGEVKWYFTKDAEFNIAHPQFVLLWAIMIIPFLIFVFKDFKTKPEFLRRNFLIVLPTIYIAAFFFIARMREIDKALTIFLILIPLAVYSLVPQFVKKEKLSV